MEFNQLNTSFFEMTSNCNRDETFYSETFLFCINYLIMYIYYLKTYRPVKSFIDHERASPYFYSRRKAAIALMVLAQN